MDIVTIILNAANAAKVSGILLLGICTHESGNFKLNYSVYDNGSPSYGVCQVKLDTAARLGFKGSPKDLNDPRINSKYAALYLKYQEQRYGDNWVKLASAYNAGSYNPSNRVPGCPRNLRYIKLVKKKLPESLQNRLTCGSNGVAEK